jgi:hypothetical protein
VPEVRRALLSYPNRTRILPKVLVRPSALQRDRQLQERSEMNLKEHIRKPEVLVILDDPNTSNLPGSFRAGSDYSEDEHDTQPVEVRVCATDDAGYEYAAQTLRKIADELSIYRKLYENDTARRTRNVESATYQLLSSLNRDGELSVREKQEVARLLEIATNGNGVLFDDDIPF